MACERRLRLGIIGTAKIADKICWAVEQSSNCTVVAVASRTHERARCWADERGIPLAYGSYDELITSQDVDAVYIALPCAMHARWVTQAASHGLHVLCEKPLAASAAEADMMLESCRRAGVLLMDGQMWPHHPRTEAMLGALASLGPVRRATCCLCFKAPDDFWQTNIRADASLEPLGSLGDLGWYCAAALDAVLAPNGELPVRVCAHIEWSGGSAGDGSASGGCGCGDEGGAPGSAPASASSPAGVPIAAHALLVYPSGASGSFYCGFDVARRDFLEVHGAVGSLRCDDWVHPREHDTFGASVAQLRAGPPPRQYAGFRVRQAGQEEWEDRHAEPCWQEVRMVQRFAAAAMAAKAPGLAHPSPVPPTEAPPDRAAPPDPPLAQTNLLFDAEQRRWGGAARRVQGILEACLVAGGSGELKGGL